MSSVKAQSAVSDTPASDHVLPVRRRFSGLLVRSAWILATLVLCLVILEVGLRLAGRYNLDNTAGYFEQSGLSYGLKKNATKRVFWPTMSFVVHTDEFGFRAAKPGPRNLNGKPYYAILGASDVFGNGLDYDKTFIGVLAGKMAAHHIEVVDMGVGAHKLMEQSSRFKEFVNGIKVAPKAVVITMNPVFIAAYDDVNPSTIVVWGELFDKSNWRLPLLKLMLSKSSAVYCFFRDSIRNVQLNYFSREDFSLDFYTMVYSKNLPIRSPAKVADFEKKMGDLETYIRSLGATPICAYVPTSGGFLLNKLKAEGKVDGSLFDTEFYEEIAKRHCAEAGIQFVDLQPMLQERYDRGEKLNFDLDAHFNGPTSKAVGDYFYESLKPSLAAIN